MRSLLILAFLTYSIFGYTQDITYTKDIAQIVYNKCTNCHRPGEIGPFPLTSYNEVKDRAATIKYVTGERIMPPWKADPNYSHFLDENYLSDQEIQDIANWVDNGTPYGLASEEPDLPNFPTGSALGTPDLVLEFAETHVHPGNNRDEYIYFVLPTGLTEDRVIKAIEMRPGNSQIVHHALFFQDTTGKAAQYDANTPEYGFPGTAGFSTDAVLDYDQYPGYVPGQKPRYFPEGIGQRLKAGSDLVVQVHYAPYPITETDKSSVNIFFADESETINRYVDDRIMLPFDLQGGFLSFYLQPNQVKQFHGTWTLEEDRSLVGIFPHMHYLGKDWEVYLEHTDGTLENLISIPEWDFNWQGGYYFTRFIKAEKNSKIHALATYDNTSDNPSNPSNPPKFVSWGEGTEDEMYYLPILSVPYQNGDEDVIFDQTASNQEIEYKPESGITKISPNPVDGQMVNVEFHAHRGDVFSFSILDEEGKLVKVLRSNEYFPYGTNYMHFDSERLKSGIYFINMQFGKFNSVQKFIKL